ncbi:MAG: DUF4417 domain-containing protein [Lachnospiraceae bacterium]|nr:DUF4417 domain-containing protein [Lachnospiraceae bacterium]
MPVYKNKDYVSLIEPLPSYVEVDISGIPFIEKDDIDISNLNNGKWLIKGSNCKKSDKEAHNKIVHEFCYDKELRKILENPYKYLAKVGSYYAVSTPDLSLDDKMNRIKVYGAVFDSRWMGAFLQANGKKVITTVQWCKEEYFRITHSGLRDGAPMMISTLGANNSISKETFFKGYHYLREKCPSSQIICVGDRIEGMDSDICYIKYEESFGSKDLSICGWQGSIINWNGEVVTFNDFAEEGSDSNVI